MKKLLLCGCLVGFMSTVHANLLLNTKLDVVETESKKVTSNFNDLSKNMSIAQVSESIVSHDPAQLKDALQDVINLNKLVNSQVNVAINFWNIYLDSVRLPSAETYLLGQVMNSLITTIRALSLRSSLDQAMILSLIKKQFNDEPKQNNVGFAVEAKESRIEDRWKNLRID